MKIRKLKNVCKMEKANEDIKGKLLEKEEENGHLRNHNQDLVEHIKKLKDDAKSQEETFKKIQNDNKLLENKLEEIENKNENTIGRKKSQL